MSLDEKIIAKARRQKKIKVATLLLGIFLFLYVPSLFYWLFSGNVATDIIKYGSLEDSMQIDAFLMREEYVLKATRTGVFFSEVNEGERVQAFASIASILQENHKHLLRDLNEKDQQLLRLHREHVKKSGASSYEIQKIEDDLSKCLREIVIADNLNDMGRIIGIKSEIEMLIKKKLNLIAAMHLKEESFNKAKEERARIKQAIDAATVDIKAPSSGLVSYRVDGLEGKFTLAMLKTMKPQELKGLAPDAFFLVSENSNVESQMPFAKIITQNDYYIVFSYPKDAMQTFKVNDDLKVRLIPIHREVSASVSFISEPNEGEVLVALKLDRALAESSGFRKMNISIIKSAYSGYKIPLKSLVAFNPQEKKAKIMLVKGGVTKLTEVIVHGYNEDFAIIENVGMVFNQSVNLYDTYVIDGNTVTEGEFIN